MLSVRVAVIWPPTPALAMPAWKGLMLQLSLWQSCAEFFELATPLSAETIHLYQSGHRTCYEALHGARGVGVFRFEVVLPCNGPILRHHLNRHYLTVK